MPTFAVTVAHRQTGHTAVLHVEARNKDEIPQKIREKIDRAAHMIVGFEEVPGRASVHTAAANGASTSDAAIINLLASLDQRQDRWFRRRTGVVSIMLGTFLGLSLFALTVAIIALALGRPL